MAAAHTRRALFFAAWLGLALWTWLGLERPIGDGDESIHAEILRQMLRTGDYLHTRWYGVVLYERPPLSYWLAAPFAALIPGELGVRFSSALGSFAALAVVYRSAWLSWQSRSAAFVAALLLAGAPSFHVFTRTLMSEAPYVFGLALALAGTLAAQRDDNPRGLPLAAAGLGFATAIKSLAVVVPLLVLLPWLALAERRRRRAGDRRTGWLSLLLFASLALPAFVLGVWLDPTQFLHEHVLFHLVQRAQGGFVGMGGGVLAYARSLLLRDGPWVSLWIAFGSVAGLALGWRWRERSLQILGSYALGVFVLMSLLGTRLPHYILPLYPAAALAVAGVYAKLQQRHARLRSPLMAAALPALAIAFALASVRYSGGSDYLFERPYGKVLGLAAKRLGGIERLYAYEWYGLSLGYYADRPLGLLSAKPERIASINFAQGAIARAGIAALVPPLPAASGSQILIAGHVDALSHARWLELGQVLAAAPPYFLVRAKLLNPAPPP